MRAKAVGVMVVFGLASLAHAGPDTVTYQGSLLNPLGGPVTNGTYQMQFKILDAATAGTNRWQETDNVQVTRGLFATTLGDNMPLGGLFTTYPDLWLEVTADVDRSGTFQADEVFSPRQNIAGVPWACPRLEPHNASPNLIGGFSGNWVTSGVIGATIAGGGEGGVDVNHVSDDHGTVSGGLRNTAGDDGGDFRDARNATVGGGLYNLAGARGATIAGGELNRAMQQYATAGGGYSNIAASSFAVIAGGYCNFTTDSSTAVIGGGEGNLTSGSPYATISGGRWNENGAWYSTIPGCMAWVLKGYSPISGLALVIRLSIEDFPLLGAPTSITWDAPSLSNPRVGPPPPFLPVLSCCFWSLDIRRLRSA